jgi:hypothetical protein
MRKFAGTIILLIFSIFLFFLYKNFVYAYYDANNCNVELKSDTKEIVFQDHGDIAQVNISIKSNTRNVISSNNGVLLSYHLLNTQGNVLVYDFPRFQIDHVDPYGRATVPIIVEKPPEAGRYLIEVDLLIEEEYWFKDRNNRSLILKMESY